MINLISYTYGMHVQLPTNFGNLNPEGLPRILKMTKSDGDVVYGFYHQERFVSNDVFVEDVVAWSFVE